MVKAAPKSSYKPVITRPTTVKTTTVKAPGVPIAVKISKLIVGPPTPPSPTTAKSVAKGK